MKLTTRDIRLDPGALADTGEFEGYGCVFGVRDSYGTKFQPGCFKRSIADRGAAGIKMLLGHDTAKPVGAWMSLAEDDKGLKVRGRLLKDDIAAAREAFALMKAGVLDGLSVGFRIRKSRTDTADGTEAIEDTDLLEISPVLFPSVPGSAISTVRGRMPTEREFETWLTQDAGFTRSQAREIISRGFKALSAKPGAGDGERVSAPAAGSAFAAELDRLSSLFN